jgi:undecaprenyl diphosphate synthase
METGGGRRRAGRARLFGHHEGARRVKDIVRACPDLGVDYLTIFAFSTENWKRTQTEVAGLMKLFKRYIRREAASLFEENVRVRFIGDRVRLEPALVDLMDGLELMTAGNDGTNLTIALNYGGRDEVTRAARRWPMTWPPESSTRATSATRPFPATSTPTCCPIPTS